MLPSIFILELRNVCWYSMFFSDCYINLKFFFHTFFQNHFYIKLTCNSVIVEGPWFAVGGCRSGCPASVDGADLTPPPTDAYISLDTSVDGSDLTPPPTDACISLDTSVDGADLTPPPTDAYTSLDTSVDGSDLTPPQPTPIWVWTITPRPNSTITADWMFTKYRFQNRMEAYKLWHEALSGDSCGYLTRMLQYTNIQLRFRKYN